MSRLVRNGSHNSSLSSNPSVDSSSLDHFLSTIRSIPESWLRTSWLPQNYRHERVAVGNLSAGMAVLTREMMEMHIQQAPEIRGFLDCLPVADRSNNAGFIGWRQKLGTWEVTKHQALTSGRFF